MQWLALVPLVIKLISFVENLIADAGKGEVKKSVVMGATKTILEAGAAVSTGGQKETWEKIAPAVSGLIDASVSLANAAGWEAIKPDPVVTSG